MIDTYLNIVTKFEEFFEFSPNFFENKSFRMKSSSPSEDNISESEICKKSNHTHLLKNANNDTLKISKERKRRSTIKETSFLEVRKGSQKIMRADPLI